MSTSRRTALALAGTAALVTAAAAPAAASGSADASVSVVHGIPDTPVDVYVDGDRLLDDFEPGTVTDPVSLPAGSYELAVTAADAADASSPLLSATAEVPAGANISVVAHLSEAGEPTLTPFVNDTSELGAGQARATVRHTAAAPAVDVLVGGSPAVTGLTNPGEESLEVPAGTVSAAVAAAGTTEPVIGPADLELAAGTTTIAYAIGSLEAGDLDLLVQVVQAGHSSPSGVPAGTEGLASGGLSAGDATLAGLAGLVALGAGAAAVRRRSVTSA